MPCKKPNMKFSFLLFFLKYLRTKKNKIGRKTENIISGNDFTIFSCVFYGRAWAKKYSRFINKIIVELPFFEESLPFNTFTKSQIRRHFLVHTYLVLVGQRKLCILCTIAYQLYDPLCPKGFFCLIYLRFWCIIYFENKGNFLFTDDSLMEWNREPRHEIIFQRFMGQIGVNFAGWTI